MFKKLSHNLIGIIDACKKLYKDDENSLKFLNRLNAIIRMYYYPLYKNRTDWAAVRYPVRFYNDNIKESKPRGFLQFPPQRMFNQLLCDQKTHLVNKWEMGPLNKKMIINEGD